MQWSRLHSDATWMAGYTPLRADLESFDFRAAAGVNGDDGGAYAPTSPIVFNTSGSTAGFTIAGPLKVCYGGTLTTRLGARLVLPAGAFEQLAPSHAGRTRTLVTPCGRAAGSPKFAVRPVPPYMGLQAVALRWRVDPGDGPAYDAPSRWLLVLRTHDGGTLASVTLTYVSKLGTPRARLVRIDHNGEILALTRVAAAADDGWLSVGAADTKLAVQTVTLTADPGVVVDKSLFAYALEVEEDQTLPATGYPNYLQQRAPVKAATTSDIVLRNLPTIDGTSIQVGDTLLVRAQNNPAENGLWVVQGVGLDFVRAGALTLLGVVVDIPGAFPQGYVVPVRYGDQFASTAWQMTSPTVTALGTSPQTFAQEPLDPLDQAGAFAANGNVYLAASALHTGITDTRWQ